MRCPLTLVTLISLISIVSSGFPNDSGTVLGKKNSRTIHSSLVLAIHSAQPTPFVISPVPDQELTTLSEPLAVPLLEVFSSDDNSTLRFDVTVNNENVAEAEISNDTLYVKPERPGNARIRIIARDDDNDSAVDAFRITVRENNPPQVTQDAPIQDQVIIQGDTPFVLNLFALFDDPDGDILVFSATSSNESVSLPQIERGVLTAPALQPGKTRLTIFANDQLGGQTSIQFELEVLRPYPGQMQSGLELDFGPINESSSYRLVALPGNQSMRIEETVDGDVNEDWITFAADSLVEGGLIPYNSTGAFRLRPGNGLWFLSSAPWSLPEQFIATVPLGQSGTYRIPLHSGWNIISNPFDIDLAWKDVADWNNISQALWSWQGNYALTDTFYAAVNHGEAFYYYNEEERLFLDLPYPGFANPFFSKTNQSGVEDIVRLTAIRMDASLARVEAGFSTDASSGSDGFDYYAPPAVFSEIALHIKNEHQTFKGLPLARDILPAELALRRYKMELHSSPGMPIQLSADMINTSGDEHVLLVNEHDGAAYNLSTISHVWITPEKETTPLTLLVGQNALVEQEAQQIAPSLYTLKQNFPNPFNASTTIEFSLPEEQYVTLKVFDSSGRLVAVLVDKTLEAGLHRVSWTTQRNTLANGIYLYRLDTGNNTLHRTMVLLK